MEEIETAGQLLYGIYLQSFGSVFAPKWGKLTDDSRGGWEKTALAYRAAVSTHYMMTQD